jgi:hypothetical protein
MYTYLYISQIVLTNNVAYVSKTVVSLPSDIVDSVVCPHNRAIEYYIEALAYPNCTFWGRKTGFFKSAVRYVKF